MLQRYIPFSQGVKYLTYFTGLTLMAKASYSILNQRRNITYVQDDTINFYKEKINETLRNTNQYNIEQMARMIWKVENSSSMMFCNSAFLDKEHVYVYKSALSILPDNSIAFAKGLGYNLMRLVKSIFPNGGVEIPDEMWEKELRESYCQKIFGNSILYDPLDDKRQIVEKYQLEKWNEGPPMYSVVQLGKSSNVLMSDHYSFTTGDLIINALVAKTTAIHPLDGTALWIYCIDTKTKKSFFAVVGKGSHPITVIDVLNNRIAAPLWDVIANMSHLMIINYQYLQESLISGSDPLGGLIAHPQVRSQLLSILKTKNPSLHTDYKILKLFDSGTGLIALFRARMGVREAASPIQGEIPKEISDAAASLFDEIPEQEEVFSKGDDEQISKELSQIPLPTNLPKLENDKKD